MNGYITGNTIKDLREKSGMTQKDLADIIKVSDKAVSKWETGRGLPDISLIEPLSAALKVSVAELLSGNCVANLNKSANLKRSNFYICPICGNVIWSSGEGSYSCCGITLPKAEIEESNEKHEIHIEKTDSETYVYLNHPMDKEHYISFLAFVTTDKVQIVKLYPEQSASCYFPLRGREKVYAYCNKHGLFCV